jgi:hypothetical protein
LAVALTVALAVALTVALAVASVVAGRTCPREGARGSSAARRRSRARGGMGWQVYGAWAGASVGGVQYVPLPLHGEEAKWLQDPYWRQRRRWWPQLLELACRSGGTASAPLGSPPPSLPRRQEKRWPPLGGLLRGPRALVRHSPADDVRLRSGMRGVGACGG